MLTLEQVKNEISKAKTKYSLKRVDVFGSYADGSATNESDLDLLVEFESDAVSLITLNNLKYDLEEAFLLYIRRTGNALLRCGRIP